MSSIFFPLAALFVDILILIMFFAKKPILSKETKIFSLLIIVNLIECILDIFAISFVRLGGSITIFSLLQKIDLAMILLYVYILYIYIYDVSSLNNKIIKFLSLVVATLMIALLIVSPNHPIVTSEIIDSKGLASEVAYIGVALFIIGMILCIFISSSNNRKKILSKKYFPIYVLFVLGIIGLFFRKIFPSIIFEPFVMCYVTLIMYHTIENPDIKMLKEFKKNKEYAENVNKEKELFLFNITQDIRTPLMDIKDACTKLSTLNDKNEIQKGIRYINAKGNSIINLVNDVLDISDMDISNIKIVNNKYNPKLLLESVAKNFKAEVNGNIDFRINIDKSIPDSLYGDSIRIKQVLKILLENANKYTNKGFIELSAHEITKRNICRLIITIEDSGKGISADELSNIFDKDNIKTDNLEKIDDRKSNLAVAKIVFSLLGGLLTFYSEIGEGTKFTLILDQRIDEDKSIELEKIEQFSESITKPSVIVVSEDQDYLNKAVKKLSKNLDVVGVDLGAKAIEKVRKNQRYDYILLDEDLEILNIGTVLTKLKEIKGFKSQVCVLVRDLKNDKYLKLGFDKIISRRLTSKEIEQLDEK